MPQLTNIITIEATLEVLTGLRIGAGDNEMHIGGVDNTVIKHPLTGSPYIPGSSLKGKMRSLLEWRSGAVKETPLGAKDFERASAAKKPEIKRILQLLASAAAIPRMRKTWSRSLAPRALLSGIALWRRPGKRKSATTISRSPKSKAKTSSTASAASPNIRATRSAESVAKI